MRNSIGNLPRAVPLFAIAVAVALVAGCSADPRRNTAAPTPSSEATILPSGSVTVGCDLARAVGADTPPPGVDDLVIGPLVFSGLAHGYNFGDPPDADADGVTFFKIGAELTSDATVTVSIGKSARSYAGILTEKGPSVGYSSVRYQGCSSEVQPGPVFWVGGFTLVGRKSACVPLVVQVKGETESRHLVLPIESRSCTP
jgi:hypothetical protein